MFTWNVTYQQVGKTYTTAVLANTQIGAKKLACKVWKGVCRYDNPAIEASICRTEEPTWVAERIAEMRKTVLPRQQEEW